jgi:hypothetical protein
MGSAEWENHFRAWVTAGAVEQELWGRLCNAQIIDAGQGILDAQRQMGQLTPEQGAQGIRLLLEENPGSRDTLSSDLLTHFLENGPQLDRVPVLVERASESLGTQ